MTNTKSITTTVAVAATLGLATVCWVILALQMSGLHMMGGVSPLGSFISFMSMWLIMMVAMMLPSVIPAVLKHIHISGRVVAVLQFVGAYLTVWVFVGIPVYALSRPHGTLIVGVIIIAAGIYELTPFKQFCRRHCREKMRSGFECGLYCVGSCIGLMLMQVALGVTSMTWMAAIALIVLAQKLLPYKAAIDVPLALMIIGLGILILIAPPVNPGLIPSICTPTVALP